MKFPRTTYVIAKDDAGKTSEKTTTQVTMQDTAQVDQLLEVSQGEMTRGEIMKKLDLKKQDALQQSISKVRNDKRACRNDHP